MFLKTLYHFQNTYLLLVFFYYYQSKNKHKFNRYNFNKNQEVRYQKILLFPPTDNFQIYFKISENMTVIP